MICMRLQLAGTIIDTPRTHRYSYRLYPEYCAQDHLELQTREVGLRFSIPRLAYVIRVPIPVSLASLRHLIYLSLRVGSTISFECPDFAYYENVRQIAQEYSGPIPRYGRILRFE